MSNNVKQQLLKIAKSIGLVSSIVEDALSKNNKTNFKILGTAGSGTAIMGTEKLIKDDGTLNVTINFRGLAAHPQSVGHLKLNNGMLITATAIPHSEQEKKENLGSALLVKTFNLDRIQNIIKAAIDKAKKAQPDKEIKKVVVNFMGFSGGGAVVSHIISAYEANPNMFNVGIPVSIGAIAINDGLHNKNPALVRFAEQAKQDPTKHRLYILHTAVQTQGYPSTTETANYLIDNLGLKKEKYNGPVIPGLQPTHIAQSGGVTVLSAYDKIAPYYVDNRPGSMGDQHVQAARLGYIPIFDDLNKLLSLD